MSDLILERLDDAERRVRALETELVELRTAVVARPAEPEPADEPASEPTPRREPGWIVEPARTPAPREAGWLVAPAGTPAPPRRPSRPWHADLDLSALLGARALAWSGGVVTLLGVVFFFALAVSSGWIGPVERVLLGAAASALVFAAGIVAERRFGRLDAALAATGAGLAGGYATLLAAAALYDLLPAPVALAAAGAIAAAGLALSLLWRSELVAGIGLVGAIVVPFVVLAQAGELSVLGTGFVVLVLAAAAAVAVRLGWETLLAVAALVALPQLAILAVQEGTEAGAGAVAVTAAGWAVALAAALAWHRLPQPSPLERLSASLTLASAALGGIGAFALADGSWAGADARGLVLAGLAAAYGALAAALHPRPAGRDASVLLGAIALGFAAVATAQLLGGQALTVAWAAEAAVLAWLAVRIRELRYQVPSLLYLALAIGHALAVDAEPAASFFRESASPGAGLPGLLAVAVAAAVVAVTAARSAPAGGGRLARSQDTIAAFGALAAGALGAYAVGLAVLELAVRLGGADAFEPGHVAVTGTWGLLAAAALAAGAWARRAELTAAGVALAVVVATKLVAYDAARLAEEQAAVAGLLVAAAALAGAVAHEVLWRRERPSFLAGALVVAGALLAGASLPSLAEGRALGAWLLVAAAVHGALAVPLRGRRDLATMLGAAALALGLPGSWLLLPTSWLTLAWSAVAAALLWLAARGREPRLEAGGLTLLGLALALALGHLAPPGDLLVANDDPAAGVPALLPVILAIAAAARLLSFARSRRLAPWVAAGLALYAASLATLGLVALVGGADVATEFQRGHTAVSALWGAVGVAVLVAGLRARRQSLRLAGFALLFGSLAKLFLYDLSALSSIARALSFLAVGMLLLVAGFFYQRLGAAPEQ